MAIALLIITWLVLGYNLFQLSSAYSWVDAQILRYRAFVQEEKVAPSYLRRFNLFTAIGMGVLYLALLYFAGIAWWLLACVLAKFFITGLISDQMQQRILLGLPFSRRHHWMVKADAFANAITLSFILLVCVFP